MARTKRRRREERAAPPPPKAVARARTAGPTLELTLGPTLARVAGPLVIAAAGIAMVAHTWRTWPDPLIDFGREIYLAWRVSAGDTLYAEVMHYNGPLSVYLNALVFRIFGPGVLTLALANATLTAGCV